MAILRPRDGGESARAISALETRLREQQQVVDVVRSMAESLLEGLCGALHVVAPELQDSEVV